MAYTDLIYHLALAEKHRAVGGTQLNQVSSRSHMIITLIVKSKVTRKSREFIIAENVCQVCVLDLTADFGDNTKAKLTPE